MTDRKRGKPHEAFTILLDVGSNSAQSFCDEDVDDLFSSKQLLDWILSRKIFIESDDQFSLIFFGHQTTKNNLLPSFSNIYIHNEEYETAKINWLNVLNNDIKSNSKDTGNYLSALFIAVESLRILDENQDPKLLTARTVVLVSNLAGVFNETELYQNLPQLIHSLCDVNAQLMIIGPDLESKPKNDAQRCGFNFIKNILEHVRGCTFTFREGLSQLKFFVPKQTQPRGHPLSLELARDFFINLQMYVKNAETSMKFTFDPIAKVTPNFIDLKATENEDLSIQLKKRRIYETTGDSSEGMRICITNLDNIADDAFRGGSTSTLPVTRKIVDKASIIKGYRYGQSLIPFGAAEQTFLEYSRTGKQLQLLQFTKIENILPQFILSNCRYFLADIKDHASVAALSTLVTAMLELGVVALCRYAYNASSNPRVACLIPKISKRSNVPVLMHYTLPFNEDLRNYEFSPLETLGESPTEIQLDVVDHYINSFLLVDPDDKSEQFRCRKILNPKHQFQCQVLRHKAIHPGVEFPERIRNKLLEAVSPPNELLQHAKPVVDALKETFPLKLNVYNKKATTCFSQFSDQIQLRKSERDQMRMKLDDKDY